MKTSVPHRLLVPALALLGSGLTLPLSAQEDIYALSLEDLLNMQVEIGSFSSQSLRTHSASISVVDQEQLADFGFLDAATALDSMAGMTVWRTYLKRSLPISRGVLQEHYANKVLVMMDGVPVWNAVTGEGNLQRLPGIALARVEALKGPSSVVYGSQAYAGAVQLVSKTPAQVGHHGAAVGGLGLDEARWAGVRYEMLTEGGTSLLVAAEHRQGPRHDYPFRDETGVTAPVVDFLDSESVLLKAQTGGHTLLLNAFRAEEGYFGVTPRHASGAGHPQFVEGWLTAYTFRHEWSDRWGTQASLWYDAQSRDLSRKNDNTIRANIDGYRYGGQWQVSYRPTEALSSSVGVSYNSAHSNEYRNIKWSAQGVSYEDNEMSDRSVDESSVFADLEWRLDPVTLVAGSRLSDNEITGRNVSSRAAVLWNLHPHHRLKLLAGQSYRSPSLFEMYFATSTRTVFGNTGLSPEESDSIELIHQWEGSRWFSQLTLYSARYSGTILRQKVDLTLPDGTVLKGVSQYANGNEFEALGLEWEGRFQLTEALTGFATFDILDGSDGDRATGTNHYNFKYAPEENASAGLSWKKGGWTLSTTARWTGAMAGPREEISGYLVLDGFISYRHRLAGLEWQHGLNLGNLLDQEVTIPEYVVHNVINELPLAGGFSALYTLQFSF